LQILKKVRRQFHRVGLRRSAMPVTMSDTEREAAAAAGLSVATIFAFVALNLLFVTAALALASSMPGWAAGLIVAGLTLVIALAIGLTAWNKCVIDPLARTRRTIKEDVRWSKEKLA
jgi:apolipoprotein N-acyltransferase